MLHQVRSGDSLFGPSQIRKQSAGVALIGEGTVLVITLRRYSSTGRGCSAQRAVMPLGGSRRVCSPRRCAQHRRGDSRLIPLAGCATLIQADLPMTTPVLLRGRAYTHPVPGRINDEDIATVRERARIDEVVGSYVALRNAGRGTLKGLCPFHDEKTPSFQVNPVPRLLLLLRLRRGRRRHRLRAEDRQPVVHRGRRASRRPGGHPAALHRRGSVAARARGTGCG